MSPRDEVLARVRAAIADVAPGDTPGHDAGEVTVAWRYGRATAMPDVIRRFVERVEDYEAEVHTVKAHELADTITAICLTHKLRKVVVPAGVPQPWREAVLRRADVVSDHAGDTSGEQLTNGELDAVHAVLTAARVGIAETGTIVLDHAPDQGRRALTLIPDVHLCVIRADQIVSDVPEAVAWLGESIAARRPLTWISGPSATSDIELARVEGVHGPRTLIVVVVA